MKSKRIILVALLLGSTSLPSLAQRRQGNIWKPSGQAPHSQQQGSARQDRRGGDQQLDQAKGKGKQQGDNQEKLFTDILSLPPEKRLPALEKDPAFRRLSPDEQQKLRSRLDDFNRLSPEAQKRITTRIKILRSLTPQQRLQAWELNGRLLKLPYDSRQRVLFTVGRLRNMSSRDRQEFYRSDQFRNLALEEQLIIQGLSDLGRKPEDGSGD